MKREKWVFGVAIYRLENTNIRGTPKAKQRSKMKKLDDEVGLEHQQQFEEKVQFESVCVFPAQKEVKLTTIKRCEGEDRTKSEAKKAKNIKIQTESNITYHQITI